PPHGLRSSDRSRTARATGHGARRLVTARRARRADPFWGKDARPASRRLRARVRAADTGRGASTCPRRRRRFDVPELPEVERARRVTEAVAEGRVIALASPT